MAGGIDEHVTVIGDWVPPNPSPRAFFSTVLDDDFGSRSFSELLEENGNDGLSVGSEKQNLMVNTKDKDVAGSNASDDLFLESGISSGHKSNLHGSLAERMAARAGFNAPRLNTERIRCANLSSSPEIRSPYLTIPPGLSPTMLLDSPVFLSNSLVQPSPTTGKLPFLCSNNKNSILFSEAPDRIKDTSLPCADASSFALKPNVDSSSSFISGSANKVNPATNNQQSFPSIEMFGQPDNSFQSQSVERADIHLHVVHPQADFSRSSIGKEIGVSNLTSDPRVSNVVVCSSDPRVSNVVVCSSEFSPPLNEQQEGEGDRGGSGESNSVTVAGAPSEDGYNWRKYGQKQVKGSEYPRSYYKCTHPNCQVKKKVERSYEGHITEIIYKGVHNHPKPPPNRRSAIGFSNPLSDVQLDISEQARAQAGADSDSVWANTQPGTVGGGPEWRHDNLEVTSSASVSPEICDPSSSLQAQNGPHFDSGDVVEVSSTLSKDEDEDDQGTHGSVALGYEGEGDESESKRRKIDACAMETGGATRAIREPRVVVQTTSEVDILDDGYRWRKYGQKVVKGNPNPRSYYKCTNAGCTVRKHVERASHDLKSVITTYEGKHNHDIPAARNSSHVNNGTCSAPAQVGQVHIHRPEPSPVSDSMARYERSNTSLNSFGLPGIGKQMLGTSNGLAFTMSQPGLGNLAMAGLGPGQRKLPMHPYVGQQRLVNEMGFMMPKGELKEEPMSEPGLSLSNGSSVYHQIMNRLPLGPQL